MKKIFKHQNILYAAGFVLVLAIGIFARFYCLGSLPGGLQRDEATVAMNSMNLYHNGTDFVGNINPFYMTDWGDGHTNMYVWLTMLPMALSGGKINNLVSRFPQAFVSVMTLICVYGIGKRIFNVRYAICAMLLVAVSPWHIMMSRWGLDANLAPGFYIIAFYFLVLSFEKPWALILSGLFYGFTLYTFAVTWIVVPVTLIFLFLYLYHYKKIQLNGTMLASVGILFLVAIPPMLFVLVNNSIISEIRLPFFSIVKMSGYRGQEVSDNIFNNIIINLKQAYHLFVYQADAGEIWEIRKPWGLFYNLGRVYIVLGAILLFISVVKALIKRQFAYEVLLVILVASTSVVCLVAYPHLHRVNLMYIPLMLVGAYGMFRPVEWLKGRNEMWSNIHIICYVVAFGVCFGLFWNDYTGDYRNLVEAYWGIGMDDCVNVALEECKQNDLNKITVEKAAQWPKLILYTQTLAPQFVSTAVYESYPMPWSFETEEGITIQTRIDYDNIEDNSVYIIYFTDYDVFKEAYELTPIHDWYVATPKISEKR